MILVMESIHVSHYEIYWSSFETQKLNGIAIENILLSSQELIQIPGSSCKYISNGDSFKGLFNLIS